MWLENNKQDLILIKLLDLIPVSILLLFIWKRLIGIILKVRIIFLYLFLFLTFWFVLIPDIRLGYAYLAFLWCIVMSLPIKFLIENLNLRINKGYSMYAFALCILLMLFPGIILFEYDFKKHFQEYPEVKTNTIVFHSNTILYVPINSQCWNHSLPCGFGSKGLEMRTNNIQNGFRINPDQ
jgi:hypothetical protein